jgi:hypothetical protein
MSASKSNWTFLLYEKSSSKIINGFLEWLKISDKVKPFPKTVNTSLTLGQIKIMNSLRPKYKYKIEELYIEFIKLGGQSHDNPLLKIEFFRVAENFFSKHQETIESLKKLMPNSNEAFYLKPEVNILTKMHEGTSHLEAEIVERFTKNSSFEYYKRLIFILKKIKGKIYRTFGLRKKMDMTSFGGSIN